MTYEADIRQCKQRDEVYRLTSELLDAVLELPMTLECGIVDIDDVEESVRKCERILKALRLSTGELCKFNALGDSALAMIVFAMESCVECEQAIGGVRFELLTLASV
jgi:hypothetical protein